jgi:ABC-type lipoprotein release transport system permease subunit
MDKIVGDADMAGGMPYWGTVYGEWNLGTMALLFVFGVIMATVAGIVPARKAGTMEVTRALRFN